MYFRDSIMGLLVGRSQAGKNYTISRAYDAVGQVAGGTYRILSPCIYVDVEGSQTKGPLAGQPEDQVRIVTVSEPAHFDYALELLRSGAYRLGIMDGWSRLFIKYAAYFQRTNPHAKNRNMDWNREARDQVARQLEEWFDVGVRHRGIVLLSTALLTDHWVGQFGEDRRVIGERVAVSETIEPRLISHHNFIWRCQRLDPKPIFAPDGSLDIDATNTAYKAGQIKPRFLCYTRPFMGMDWCKFQEGFASEVDAIAENINLGEILSRHHEAVGIKS